MTQTVDKAVECATIEPESADRIRQELENTERQLISALTHIWRILGKNKRVITTK